MPLAGFKLHQSKDKSISFIGYSNSEITKEVTTVLNNIFDNNVALNIKIEKISQNNNVGKSFYSSDL